MRKGQAESVIRELIRGRSTHRLQYSSNVQIHIQLLSLIQKDKGEKYVHQHLFMSFSFSFTGIIDNCCHCLGFHL